MQSSTKGSVIKGTIILTIAALIVKILSAIYRIPYQNMVGDVGYYAYQQVYPLYAIFLILVTQGFPVVLSKLYIESRQFSLGLEYYAEKFVKKILFIFGVIGFLFLFLGAEWVATTMGDKNLTVIIYIISPVYLLLPMLALLRGRFQSMQYMVPTAISQVVEQIIRVGVILLAAFVLTQIKGYTIYETAEGAYVGAVLGGIVATFILWGFYKKEERIARTHIQVTVEQKRDFKRKFTIYCISIGTTSLLMVLFQLAESINLYKSLALIFPETEAKSLKGIYDRAWPLIQLGLVIATSLGLNLITYMTEVNEKEQQVAKINASIKYTAMISLAAAVGLIMIMKPTNIFLFMNSDGTAVISILVLSIFFGSLIITISSILQGLGHMFIPVIVILLGFGLKVWLNPIAVSWLELQGAAILTIVLLAGIALALYLYLNRVVQQNCLPFSQWLKIFFAVISMAIVVFLVIKLGYSLGIWSRFQNAILAISSACIGGISFIIVALNINIFSNDELRSIPFINKLKRR